MTTNYRYTLDDPKVTGRQRQKTTCPQCGRKKCLVRYIDTHDDCKYLNDAVGRCDHEQSCGYHYKPSEYFHDNPWLRTGHDMKPVVKNVQQPPRIVPILQPLDPYLLYASRSPRSTFWQWFSHDCANQLHFDAETIQRVFNDYQIGATRNSDIIFWQIDEDNRIHTGHIMCYGPDGHRLGYQNWVHSRLIKEGRLPKDFYLFQCLFGQHLLPRHPHKQVCIVESEKTAIIMAAHQPEHLWLATAGCGGLSAEKLACLKGRTVRLFPDSGCYEKWCDKMAQTSGINYSVYDGLEAYPPNTDLADILLSV